MVEPVTAIAFLTWGKERGSSLFGDTEDTGEEIAVVGVESVGVGLVGVEMSWFVWISH